MSKPQVNTDTAVGTFKEKLQQYKQLIDEDIKSYSKSVQKTTLQLYGSNARVATDAYLDILARGGKRIRGALVMLGYEMSGGQDQKMILQAARAVEMMHAYILIIDDIQDRSPTRRGGPTAHYSLADYHRKHQLADGPEHFGVAIALNAALGGAHAAQMILANLEAPEGLRIKVLSIMNSTMLITAHGQTNDIINEVVHTVTKEDIDRVLEWKTAYYTLLNPLHVGMVLAGAESDVTNAITGYALNAGRAFQISDDILGTFGTEFESGKSPMDDIKEGKRTYLTMYALEHAPRADKNSLIQMLGNHKLTQTEFALCKDILTECGALAYARSEAERCVNIAIEQLDKEAGRWSKEGVNFLRDLAKYLLVRTS